MLCCLDFWRGCAAGYVVRIIVIDKHPIVCHLFALCTSVFVCHLMSEMDARPVAVAILVHFTVLHSAIALFHFTIGVRYVTPAVQAVFPNSYFNFAASVPHDLLLTFMLMYIVYWYDPHPRLPDAFVVLIVPTMTTSCLSELRVLLYFELFPKRVSVGMLVTRCLIALCANACALYAAIGWY